MSRPHNEALTHLYHEGPKLWTVVTPDNESHRFKTAKDAYVFAYETYPLKTGETVPALFRRHISHRPDLFTAKSE